MTRSICLRAAIRPLSKRCLYSCHSSESGPPITSTNSGVNLNGDCSKPAIKKKIYFTMIKRNI